MCNVDMGLAMSKTTKVSDPCKSWKAFSRHSSGKWQSLPACLPGLSVNIDNVCPPLSPLLDVYSMKTALLHRLILPTLANPILDQAVYHKPCLLVLLYAISLPLCSTLYIINLLKVFYSRAQTIQLSVCCPSVFSSFHCFPYSSPTPWRTTAKNTAAVSQ